MHVSKEIVEARTEMKAKVIKVCEEGRLVGRLVRNFGQEGGRWQRWGIVQSLTVEDDILVLRAGEREDYGHEPFESSMPLELIHFFEDGEATFISGGNKEWKFFF